MRPLADSGKLSSYLLQLSPAFKPPSTVEFRHRAWLHDERRDATRGWVRGRTVAERLGYRYDAEELEELAQRAERLAERADSVRMMFNNNRGDDAPVAAAQMKDLLS